MFFDVVAGVVVAAAVVIVVVVVIVICCHVVIMVVSGGVDHNRNHSTPVVAHKAKFEDCSVKALLDVAHL